MSLSATISNMLSPSQQDFLFSLWKEGESSLSLTSSWSLVLLLAATALFVIVGGIVWWLFPNLIDTICKRTYIYNICWEDPAVDLEILQIQPDDVIFRICSAGDIVLDYAIEGPSKIVVCDMNQHQLWLFELKVRMLRDDPALTYDEWWSIWGSSDVNTAMKVWKRMRHTMSQGGREWWDGRIERVFRNGFHQSGSTGWAANKFLPWLSFVVGLDVQAWADTGFSHEYIAQNEHVLERLAWWFRRLFPSVLAPFAGVPPNQIGPEFYTTEFYEKILREIFLDPNFGSSNYFYRFYYERGYKDQTCCPRILKKAYFDQLRSNAGCFEWHHASVQETMERVKPNSFTKLVLLDHLDWLPNHLVHEEWIALQRASVPGAKVLWRSAFTKMDDKPFFNCLDITDLSPDWYSKDRVKMYPGTFTCNMPRDPFPFVDPRPSPCQEASLVRKVKTTTKMVLHPLTAGKSADAHGDKMSSFYAAQAIGYDAVREKMLVARPEMMAGFGPIKQGHTWLDIGGGTGRNVHYLRSQLDLFERIVVLDICPELLEIGKENARQSFTAEQCSKIHWVCLDINSEKASQVLNSHLSNKSQRGFDTISFSYSLSMIPEWQQAILSAKALLSDDGRIIIADFDTYTEKGNSIRDMMIRTWYKQDGVRIEAKSREFIRKVFSPSDMFVITMARFQRKLAGVWIPHYVACCRKLTITTPQGFRRPSLLKLTLSSSSIVSEEKKCD